MFVDTIPDSPILTLMERIFRMRAAGETIIGLHIGEPDFDTPPGIRAAAARALEEGQTHYGSSQGTPSSAARLPSDSLADITSPLARRTW
ncbi:aminotransferase class I and II [mine drainage metagenome]|uniref:Aminotransferase class I and II n=1 Tax=mine drainage metagenome TaxID=410659 RepID=T0ZN94_9ZZZZ